MSEVARTPEQPAPDPQPHEHAGDAGDHDLVRAGLEALLFLAEEPVSVANLAETLERPEDEVSARLEALAAEYLAEGRGMEVRRAAGGWRMYSSPLARPVLERWALAGRTGRLTQAALETLAIIAYKQPIGRQAIGDIRGVNPDAAVRSLVARGLVAAVGRDDSPGQPVLYGTTPLLLERLGIDSLEELPELTDYLPEAPAPDEPELHALREVRRRLSAAGQAAAAAQEQREDEDDDALPPPAAPTATAHDPKMDELTDELDRAARSAIQRLRAAVSAGAEHDRDAQAHDDHDDHDGVTTAGHHDAEHTTPAASGEGDHDG